MKNSKACLSLNHVEDITPQPLIPRFQLQKPWKAVNLSFIARFLEQYFLAPMSHLDEPKIWEKRDRSGNVFYKVYDPITGISNQFSSDLEVRIWLEERYRR